MRIAQSLILVSVLFTFSSLAVCETNSPQGNAKSDTIKNGKTLAGPRINVAQADLGGQISAIKKAIEEGVMFSELPQADLNKINTDLSFFSELASKTNADTSNASLASNDVLARQTRLNALLDRIQEDSRLICKREQLTGSHRMTRTCSTVAEINRVSEQSRSAWKGRNEAKLDAPRIVQ